MPSAAELKQLLPLLAPGFVILGIRQWFMVSPPPSLSDRALAYAAVSAAYFAVAAPTVDAVVRMGGFTELTRTSWAYVYLPAILGLACTWFAEHDWADRLWRRLDLTPVHRIPSAWDYAFRRRSPTFVVVTLMGGSQVAGLYGGPGSFASSARDKRDILISKVYVVDQGSEWAEADPPKSILLCGGDIQAIEFFEA